MDTNTLVIHAYGDLRTHGPLELAAVPDKVKRLTPKYITFKYGCRFRGALSGPFAGQKAMQLYRVYNDVKRIRAGSNVGPGRAIELVSEGYELRRIKASRVDSKSQ